MEELCHCSHRGCRNAFEFSCLKLLNYKEKTQPIIMCATFKGNTYRAIVSCYSPTSASDETDFPIFYNRLSSLVQRITKPSIETWWIKNAKRGNNKFSMHNCPNINGEYLADFSLALLYIEASAECIMIKLKAKFRVPWESLIVWKKRDNNVSFLIKKSNKWQRQRFKKAPKRSNTYQKEQLEYIQG